MDVDIANCFVSVSGSDTNKYETICLLPSTYHGLLIISHS